MEVKEVEVSSESIVFKEISKLGHEQVVFCSDEGTGLKAIIAVHNTILGPSLGGTRMWNYNSEVEALTDVLRLSRGMTFKAAVSGLNIGGGKAVIIGDAKTMKNEALMRKFGKFIDSLNGKYVTAEDVNMSPEDMEYIGMETKYVTGLPQVMGGSGDPSPVTAYGTYMGIKSCAKKVFGKDSLENKKVSVQGVGHVGTHLVNHLVQEGAKVFVSDIDKDKLKKVVKKYRVEAVDEEKIFDLDVDIYAPCALGASINNDTISRMKCSIIAGAANNQLKEEIKHGYMLIDQNITYAPDFVINAGGLINVYLEFLGEYNEKRAYHQAEKIYDTCSEILEFADNYGITPQEAAMKLAKKRIEEIGKIKLSG